MNPDRIELAQLVENLQIHHPQRDGDWLTPQALRQLLRLIYNILMEDPNARP